VACMACGLRAEVGNVTSKYNGVTRYLLCYVLRVITLRSDNGSTFDRAITLGCGNGFIELEVTTLKAATFLHSTPAVY
jgi:hypothetical protein